MTNSLKIGALSTLLIALLATIAQAQIGPSQAKINELIHLLQDPEIQTWLASKKAPPVADETLATKPGLAGWELDTRERVNAIVQAIPRIPSELAAAAARTREDAVSNGYAPVMAIFASIVAFGSVIEWLFRKAISRQKLREAASKTTVSQLLPVGIFATSMAIVFFAFEWPPLARIVLLTYMIAFVAYRVLSVASGLAIDGDPSLLRRIRLFIGMGATATASSVLGTPLAIDPSVSEALSYCFSVVLLIMANEIVWGKSQKSTSVRWILSLAIVAIWILWCIDLKGLFWIGVYALVLPPILKGIDRAVRAAISQEGERLMEDTRTVLIVRGSRAMVIGLAVGWIAIVWRLNPDSLVHQDPTVTAISYGMLKSVVVLILADLLWQLARSFMDAKLATTIETAGLQSSEIARRGRMRTLLPIFRNLLAVFVIVMAALIVLSQLGVEIGPLVAGAGIFGVALGFGSQTLVKDVISGVFYMFDDAFRVGEYIQAKSYMGTVEGFSLRSVRLRHHRGPVFTVPFGELGAVQNMSRDWVIDKFKITVSYDTDINLARKIAKAIGAELQTDPELGPLFITPLKMKGVESFGDYGIVLSFAMTTVPGQQSSIRRKAYAMIREAFQAKGIEFATPSVQVGSDDSKGGAAAAATTVRAAEIKANLEKGEV